MQQSISHYPSFWEADIVDIGSADTVADTPVDAADNLTVRYTGAVDTADSDIAPDCTSDYLADYLTDRKAVDYIAPD